MDVVQYTYKARKEIFKVKEIIFISFHAEGVGTQRQSTVEGAFFLKSNKDVAATNIAFNFPSQATMFRVAWGCRRIPVADSLPESWGSGGQSGGPFSETLTRVGSVNTVREVDNMRVI
jgi:hypothetical protein